jgi:hypothetical protein
MGNMRPRGQWGGLAHSSHAAGPGARVLSAIRWALPGLRCGGSVAGVPGRGNRVSLPPGVGMPGSLRCRARAMWPGPGSHQATWPIMGSRAGGQPVGGGPGGGGGGRRRGRHRRWAPGRSGKTPPTAGPSPTGPTVTSTAPTGAPPPSGPGWPPATPTAWAEPQRSVAVPGTAATGNRRA